MKRARGVVRGIVGLLVWGATIVGSSAVEAKAATENNGNREAQKIMREVGLAPGPIDGNLSLEQTNFVRDIQKSANLSQTGLVDETTLSILRDSSIDYFIRTDVVTGLQAAKPVQVKAYESYLKTGLWPTAGDPHFSAIQSMREGTAKIQWSGAAFVVRFDGAAGKPLAGRSATISVAEGCEVGSEGCKPLPDGKTFLWRCSSADIATKYLPTACRVPSDKRASEAR